MSSGITIGQLTITPKERKTLRNILEWLDMEDEYGYEPVRIYRHSEDRFEIYGQRGIIATATKKVVTAEKSFS